MPDINLFSSKKFWILYSCGNSISYATSFVTNEYTTAQIISNRTITSVVTANFGDISGFRERDTG